MKDAELKLKRSVEASMLFLTCLTLGGMFFFTSPQTSQLNTAVKIILGLGVLDVTLMLFYVVRFRGVE